MNLSFKLKKSPELVFDYLTDMQKYVSVHPVIYKIDKTSDDNYLVYETLKFMFIPFSFRYTVTVEANSADKVVVMCATVMKWTKIKMKFVLKELDNSTVIDENIEFKSPLPIKFLMRRIFRKQHAQLFENIEMKE
jgi:carbon monoxide dehydrogenase subunit G